MQVRSLEVLLAKQLKFILKIQLSKFQISDDRFIRGM